MEILETFPSYPQPLEMAKKKKKKSIVFKIMI